jgi:hypothetical protein
MYIIYCGFNMSAFMLQVRGFAECRNMLNRFGEFQRNPIHLSVLYEPGQNIRTVLRGSRLRRRIIAQQVNS